MTTPVLTPRYLDQLTRPQPRLPGLSHWLLNEVWTEAAFEAAGRSPRTYLFNGERWMNAVENLMTAAGDRLYAELAEPPSEQVGIGRFMHENPDAAVVVFDGCSLREIPRLLQLARDSGRDLRSVRCGRAALPSDTEAFVGRRLGLGLPEIGPSKLTSRAELRERNIRCFYFGNPGDHHTIDESAGALLLWSRFPDQRYTDSTAVDETLYDALWDGLELAWQRTVQAVPPDRPVLVTSDHGNVFLGSGLSDPSLKDVDRPLEGKRFRIFGRDEIPPAPSAGLRVGRRRGLAMRMYVRFVVTPGSKASRPRQRGRICPRSQDIPELKARDSTNGTYTLAMIAGCCHNRPKAPSASCSVYRHGGLTLMEMLRPWLGLEPVSSAGAS